MDPSFLTSRLKSNFFGKSYTLKQKHLDEVLQLIESENLERQQLNEELTRLKQDLDAIEQEKEKFKRRCEELSENLNDTAVSFQIECQVNSALRTEYDNVSSKFNELQTDCIMKFKAAAEKDHAKDEKIKQLTNALNNVTANHEAQIQKLQDEHEEMRQRFVSEKSLLEKANHDIVKNMDAVQEAHNKTDTRRKQVEYEIAGLKDELENLRSGKLAAEAQLFKERKQNSVRDLFDQLHAEDSLKDLSKTLLDLQNVKNPEQSTQLIETFANGIQFQMFQQQQNHDEVRRELINEKSTLEQQNAELIEKLCNLQNVHNETEERRKRMEVGYSALKDEIERLESEKLAIEEKFHKPQPENFGNSEPNLKSKDCLDHGDSILEKDPSV